MPQQASRWLPWAAFLASSWTWCIGMFLPVLLVRDFGLLGWIAFAVPNVVGAAAMGLVMSDAEQSRRVIATHKRAAEWFSVVTIAFHLFFVFWIIQRLIGPMASPVVLAAAAIIAAIGARRDPLASCIVLALSLTAFVFLIVRAGLPTSPLTGELPPGDVFSFAMVALFGFFCCPYLDLTFHRARQAMSPAAGRKAFAVGFGILFLLMILFSLAYAPLLRPMLGDGGNSIPRTLAWVIGLHMAIQSALTIVLHGRELVARWRPAVVGHRVQFAALLVALAAAIAAPWLIDLRPRFANLDTGEVVYRCFMVFYGLLFPAYVWLVMVPGRDRTRSAIFAVAVVLAMPFYWLAFIDRRTLWAMIGLGVIVAWRLAIQRRAADMVLDQ